MPKKARIIGAYEEPYPHAIFETGKDTDGKPIVAEIRLGYNQSVYAQAEALVDNMPLEFFVIYEHPQSVPEVVKDEFDLSGDFRGANINIG